MHALINVHCDRNCCEFSEPGPPPPCETRERLNSRTEELELSHTDKCDRSVWPRRTFLQIFFKISPACQEREISRNTPCLGAPLDPSGDPLALGTPLALLGRRDLSYMDPPASEYLRLAYSALVVAQHERHLDDIRQCGHLLVTKHQLEQGEDALRRCRVGREGEDDLSRLAQVRSEKISEKYRQVPGKI